MDTGRVGEAVGRNGGGCVDTSNSLTVPFQSSFRINIRSPRGSPRGSPREPPDLHVNSMDRVSIGVGPGSFLGATDMMIHR